MSTRPDQPGGEVAGPAAEGPAAPGPAWASPVPVPAPDAPALGSWGAPPPGAQPAPASGWGDPASTGWGAPGPGPAVTAGAPGGWRRVAVKPGIVPLRPLGLGEVYDGAFQAMRRNPRTMLGASAVVSIVTTAIGTVMLALTTGSLGRLLDTTGTGQPSVDDSEIAAILGSTGLGFLGSSIVSGFGAAVLTGVLTFAVGRAVLGEKLGPGRLWTMVRPRLLPLIGLQLLYALLYTVIGAVTLGPGIALLFVEPVVGAVVLLVGVLVWLLASLLALVASSMATPALLLEEAPVGRAFVRGWRIVRMAFWRVVSTMLLTVVIVYVLSTLLAAPASVLNLVFTGLNPDDPRAVIGLHPVQLAISGLVTVLSSTVVLPFLAGVATLLYIDVRMRREGLDVELASAAAR